MMPFHMHINPELLEASHLTATMLLEVPYMAAHPHDTRRRQQAKHYFRYLDEYERRPYKGTPESVRDHVMAASKALQQGSWKACYNFISAMECWRLLGTREQVLGMLQQKIQEEALRTYLFTYSSQYASVAEAQLCEQFGLQQRKVHRLLCRMIDLEEISASLDEPTGTVLLHKEESTKLQDAALSFMDKGQQLLERNDRALAQVTGRADDDEGRGGHDSYAQGGKRSRGGRGGGMPYM